MTEQRAARFTHSPYVQTKQAADLAGSLFCKSIYENPPRRERFLAELTEP